ncbi:hypothetical protein AN401_12730 [Zobellella denitrificans]|uniref:Uncharacterized protein n=1 Tax=Zobellella denitrificans TaxID=347534 RepID=A0A291HR59_9GAMM|nr:hypothetical protein AN401_12730 [Zobellella denitrificans]
MNGTNKLTFLSAIKYWGRADSIKVIPSVVTNCKPSVCKKLSFLDKLKAYIIHSYFFANINNIAKDDTIIIKHSWLTYVQNRLLRYF